MTARCHIELDGRIFLLRASPTQESNEHIPSAVPLPVAPGFLSFTKRGQTDLQRATDTALKSVALKLSRDAAQFIEDRRLKAKLRTLIYNDTLQLLKQITNKQQSVQKSYQQRFWAMAAAQIILVIIIGVVY